MISPKTTHRNIQIRNRNDRVSERILVQAGRLHFDFSTCARFTHVTLRDQVHLERNRGFCVGFCLRATSQKMEDQSSQSKRPKEFTPRRALPWDTRHSDTAELNRTHELGMADFATQTLRLSRARVSYAEARYVMSSTQLELHERSLRDPEGFWAAAAESIHWYKRWDKVLDDTHAPMYRWFTGGLLNTCYNALDFHVERGRGKQPALIYDSPVTKTIRVFTYLELQELVATFGGALSRLGARKGDRVVIYMPMVPEAVIAMLACARIGAVHSVVFGGFAPSELAKRIDDAKPKLILSASCGIEVNRVVAYKPLLDMAIDLAAHKPRQCVILQRRQIKASLLVDRDIDWQDALQDAQPVGCTPVAATDPLYILYTSGTTGIPKGVVRDHGGHAIAVKWSMEAIYGVGSGEVMWTASDLGWQVGHSYTVYGPLLKGATTVLYEGKPVGTPDAGAFWRVSQQHRVNVLFTAPTTFRAIRREDPDGLLIRKYDLSQLRSLFLAGERCDSPTLHWAETRLGVPIIDHWWQTESGWPIAANCVGLGMMPVKPGSASKAVPGWDVQILSDDGRAAATGEIGNVVVKLPLPPGSLPTLWKNDDGFQKTYLARFPGYYLTNDAGFADSDGYLFIMGRTDDIINVAGHRLSTGGMEEVLAAHPDVAECAVVAAPDELKGEVPVGFVVLKAGVSRGPEEVISELVQLVRDMIGPVASFKYAAVIQRLPKTRSGKILRGTIREIATGVSLNVPATIDDPAVLDEMREVLRALGYPRAVAAADPPD
jgi:propionyl-CoA synthetase